MAREKALGYGKRWGNVTMDHPQPSSPPPRWEREKVQRLNGGGSNSLRRWLKI